MKTLILAILIMSGLNAFAAETKNTRGNDGGGGHVIVDQNGNIVAIDDYEDTVLEGDFTLEQVCPKSNLKEFPFSGVKEAAYKSALQKFDILKQDQAYQMADIYFGQVIIPSIKWYYCTKALPLNTDHKFAKTLIQGQLLQLALQTSEGEVVFSGPVLEQVLKSKNGQKILETTFIHEIVLNYDSHNYEMISSSVDAFASQSLQKLIGFKQSYNLNSVPVDFKFEYKYLNSSGSAKTYKFSYHEYFLKSNVEIYTQDGSKYVVSEYSAPSPISLANDGRSVLIGYSRAVEKQLTMPYTIDNERKNKKLKLTFNSKPVRICINNVKLSKIKFPVQSIEVQAEVVFYPFYSHRRDIPISPNSSLSFDTHNKGYDLKESICADVSQIYAK